MEAQERSDAIKMRLVGATYNDLVAAMMQAKETHSRLKDETAEAWEDVCTITRQVIPERFEADQIQNITVILPDGTKKQLLCIDQVSVKTPAENKPVLYSWLVAHDAEDLITETVNASSLAAYVREQMRQAEPYPNDICEISTYVTASLRKAS